MRLMTPPSPTLTSTYLRAPMRARAHERTRARPHAPATRAHAHAHVHARTSPGSPKRTYRTPPPPIPSQLAGEGAKGHVQSQVTVGQQNNNNNNHSNNNNNNNSAPGEGGHKGHVEGVAQLDPALRANDNIILYNIILYIYYIILDIILC